MRQRSFLGLLLGLIAVLVIVGGVLFARLSENSCSPMGRCDRVLFLGNSYTFVNDLPAVVRSLAHAGGHNVETEMVAEGGETLAQHATSGATQSALERGTWSFVVLQEQSQIPAAPRVAALQMTPAVAALLDRIQSRGATAVLFETWAHQDGWPEQRLDRKAMQAMIDATYEEIGNQLGVPVAAAGRAWEAALAADATLQLWSDDGSHPSPAGTYLAACVLYARIFNASPIGLPDTAGLGDATVQILQTAAEAAR
jgi:hypothetical protein